MTNVEMFRDKNPAAPNEYCKLAATLYDVLLRQDAFENDVQIENFHTSFTFLFPNGKISITNQTPCIDVTPVPCYICKINGSYFSFCFFSIGKLYSWLKNNWKHLINGDKDD